jgi:hypothetical protein
MTELTASHPKQAILVAGYYRSGTSALTGSLNEMGFFSVGDAESNEHNPKGFFESTDLIRLDIRIMGTLDSIWSDLTPYPDGWEKRPDIQFYRRNLTEILGRQFGDHRLVAVKHPHICRLFPLYARALSDLGFATSVLHTHRDPYVIADSQAKKNFLTRAHALALWASYITDAEYHARLYPRAWIDYQEMLDSEGANIINAVNHLKIEGISPSKISFLTRSLDRSKSVNPDGLYWPLHQLVRDISDAIKTQASADIWDDLRERSRHIGQFITEIGRSGNRAAYGVAGQPQQTSVTRGFATTFGAATHATRPPERGDSAEQNRIGALIEQAGSTGDLPTVTVHMAITEESTPTQIKDTLSSINKSWVKPDVLVIYQADNTVEIELDIVHKIVKCKDRAELSNALFAAIGDDETHYSAMITAGDQIEPDAIARFKLAALQSDAHLLYSDEIVAGPNGFWVRAKPEVSPIRLMESCVLGDWVWYRSATLRALGGFRHGDYAGAEEQDMQLRMLRHGHSFFRITEALFMRGVDSNRDGVPIETAIENARRAVSEHASVIGLNGIINRGSMIGMFVVDMLPDAPRLPVTIGLRCVNDTSVVQTMVNRLIPNMGTEDRLVMIRPRGELSENFEGYLQKIEREICPQFPALSVVDCPNTLGSALLMLRDINQDADIAMVDCVCAPSCDDIIQRLARLGRALDASIIAPKVFFHDHDQRGVLFGPLLFGAKERVGAGYDAGTPGPGGWLATTQPVDAVSGPIILLRKTAIIDPETNYFADICQKNSDVYWTPHFAAEIPYPRVDPELSFAAAQTYSGKHHHPSMTVSGNPLVLEGVRGLIVGSGSEHSALISSHGDIGGGRALSLARYAREQGAQISLVMDPVDPFSVRRALAQGRPWVRVNPDYFFKIEDRIIPSSMNIWTAPPKIDQRDIVLATGQNVATSARIASHIRGMGGKVSVWSPKLTKTIWDNYAPDDAERHVVMIVQEPGVDVPWLKDLIAATQHAVDYVLISATASSELPGSIARETPPVFEDGWLDLIAKLRISVLVRPTPNTEWCDDYIVKIATAAGCKTIIGDEGDRLAELPIDKALSSTRVDDWIKAVLTIAEVAPDREGFVLPHHIKELWLGEDDVKCLPSWQNDQEPAEKIQVRRAR